MPFLSLREDSFPWLISTDLPAYKHNAIDWNFGGMFYVQMSSELIRINKYTIQWFIMGQSSVSKSWPSFIDMQDMPTWHSLRCEPVLNAMCQVVDNNAKMLLFPDTVVDMPLNYEKLVLPSTFQTELNNKTCSSAHANRGLNVSDISYEVSLCDLVDTDLEFVYKPYENLVYWRQVPTNTTWLALSTIFSLFFFTKVCEHMLLLLKRKKARFSHSISTLPLVLACFLLNKHYTNQSFMLMYDEIILHYIVLCYVIALSVALIGTRYYKQSPDINAVSISSLLGILLALTAELQASYDNPFLQLLTYIFATRNFLKFMNLIRIHLYTPKPTWEKLNAFVKTGHWLADTFVLCSILAYGLQVSSSGSAEYITMLVSLLFMSLLTGTALHAHSYNSPSADSGV